MQPPTGQTEREISFIAIAFSVCLVGVLSAAALGISVGVDRAEASRLACAAGYSPCLPVKGDLNCADIASAKRPVRVTGDDPYGLDADEDGVGCEDSGGAESPWGLILRRPVKKEAVSVGLGETLTVVGWSPPISHGQPYELCVTRGSKQSCVPGRGTLAPRIQTFGAWKVKTGERSGKVFKLSVRYKGKNRAADTVPLR